MEKSSARKTMSIMLLICFVGTSLIPAIDASIFVAHENSNNSLLNNDNKTRFDKESSEKINVFIAKVYDDRSIKITPTRITTEEYNDYNKKIQTCKTMEEGFTVLKEYNLVPDTMSFNDFTDLIKTKFDKTQLLKIPILKNHYIENYFYTVFIAGFVYANFKPIVIPVVKIPLLTFFAISWGGGSCSLLAMIQIGDKCGFSKTIAAVFMGWVGIISLKKHIDLNGGTFAGFVGYGAIAGKT